MSRHLSMSRDRHTLPKVRDSWSYLYVEHGRVEQDAKAIAVYDADGKTPVPCASLTLLMLGPGTSITHAAVRALAENGCLVLWTGEEGVRMYAQGLGETRSAHNLLRQARLWADPRRRLEVVRRLYQARFSEPLDDHLDLRQIRGLEGIRVRNAYAQASEETGVAWGGRRIEHGRWALADPVNRALSAANSCLYGVCHAAIVSVGYSPALGFIHTGKMLSFVYDIADLYKGDLTIPLAFETVAEGTHNAESRVRRACRDRFARDHLLKRIIPDIGRVLGRDLGSAPDWDTDPITPGGLWDPDSGEVPGGINYADAADLLEAGSPQQQPPEESP